MKFIHCDIRILCLCAALTLYAVLGSPTPDIISWVEVTLMALIVGAIGLNGFSRTFIIWKQEKQKFWRISGSILWFYGLIIPLIIAVLKGNDTHVIIRDVIAFFFLCLPLFLMPLFKTKAQNKSIFFLFLLGMGGVFSLRVLLPYFDVIDQDIKLLYLANSPLVLMALIYFSLKACQNLYEKIDLKHFAHFGFYTLAASITLMAVYIDVQRAFFAALLISFISVFFIGILKSPLKVILPLLLVCITIFICQGFVVEAVESALLKTAQVGTNMRFQELQAVWQEIQGSPMTLIFGQGWGSSFPSPAVDNIYVSFTHSLLSYMLLKTGFIGLFLTIVYLFFIFEKLALVYFSDPVKGNMLLWPFIIPILFYASYKSFDFGLLLTLIIVISTRQKEVNA